MLPDGISGIKHSANIAPQSILKRSSSSSGTVMSSPTADITTVSAGDSPVFPTQPMLRRRTSSGGPAHTSSSSDSPSSQAAIKTPITSTTLAPVAEGNASAVRRRSVGILASAVADLTSSGKSGRLVESTGDGDKDKLLKEGGKRGSSWTDLKV